MRAYALVRQYYSADAFHCQSGCTTLDDYYVDRERTPRDAAGVESLTEKEFAVASLVGGGASNREIAERLAMSERTVKSHLSSIFRKMDVRDRVQLALAMNDIPVDNSA